MGADHEVDAAGPYLTLFAAQNLISGVTLFGITRWQWSYRYSDHHPARDRRQRKRDIPEAPQFTGFRNTLMAE